MYYRNAHAFDTMTKKQLISYAKKAWGNNSSIMAGISYSIEKVGTLQDLKQTVQMIDEMMWEAKSE